MTSMIRSFALSPRVDDLSVLLSVSQSLSDLENKIKTLFKYLLISHINASVFFSFSCELLLGFLRVSVFPFSAKISSLYK